MGLNIKNAAVEADIRRLARAKKIGLTEAVGLAVRRELDALTPSPRQKTAEELLAEVEAWRRDFGVDVEGLSSDHSWLYDETGLPK